MPARLDMHEIKARMVARHPELAEAMLSVTESPAPDAAEVVLECEALWPDSTMVDLVFSPTYATVDQMIERLIEIAWRHHG